MAARNSPPASIVYEQGFATGGGSAHLGRDERLAAVVAHALLGPPVHLAGS
jgi:hypothetical protein